MTDYDLQRLSDKLLLATHAAGVGIWEYLIREDKFIADDLLLSMYGIGSIDYEITMNKWMDLIHPEDKERVTDEFTRALNESPEYASEFRIIWSNGSVHYIKSVAIMQYDSSGQPESIIGTNQDITASKEAEKKIKEREEMYRSIYENSMDGILLSLTNGKIIAANPASCEIFQMTEDEICQMNPFALVNVFDPRLKDILAQEKTNQKAKGELTFFRKDGTQFSGEISSSVFVDAFENRMTLIILRDITERIIKEQQVKESERQYRQIVETAQEGIWVIDEENKTTFVNEKMCEILEYPAEEMLGKTSLYFKEEEVQKEAMNDMRKLKQGITETYESTFITGSGKKIWTNITSNPMYDSDGKYRGSLGMVTDITDKIKLQQKIQEDQQRSQKEILKAVVDAQEKERAEIGAELHDNVNQLLATSRLYINICLSKEKKGNESLKKSQEYVSEAIDEIRKLSHALVGPTHDKIVGLIPSVEDLVFDIARVKKIKVDFQHGSFHEDRIDVGLKLVIYRIIQQQINNILKHANAGSIKIELKKEGKDLGVTIEDDGKGFDTSKRANGIGLININNRAKLYDGLVKIVSSPGNGCKMKITFKNHGIGYNGLVG